MERADMTDVARVDTTTEHGTEIVRVFGEIDLSNAARVRDAIGAALPDLPVVVLDLTGTEYLDSAGVAMLFRLAERLSYNRQELQLIVPPDAPIRAVIRLTTLDQVISVKNRVHGQD
jgi:anti-anti-sigma factor